MDNHVTFSMKVYVVTDSSFSPERNVRRPASYARLLELNELA